MFHGFIVANSSASAPLLRAFAAVAVAAEHLAVVGDGAAAVAPRRDVVGLHLRKLEMRAAEGTDTVLPLFLVLDRIHRIDRIAHGGRGTEYSPSRLRRQPPLGGGMLIVRQPEMSIAIPPPRGGWPAGPGGVLRIG